MEVRLWPPGNQVPASDQDVQGLSDLVRLIVLQNLPHNYENLKEWGTTKEVWAGVDFSRDGWRVTTKRRRKTVNHGSWKRYQVQLVNPDRELLARVENVRSVPGKGACFDLLVESPLAASGRWSEWQQGVQLFSVSAEAYARVRLRVACAVGISFQLKGTAPKLSLDPEVIDAQLELTDFRLHRISDFDGPAVHKLGHALRGVLQDEIADRRAKLVTRMNSQIDKHRDVLTVSPDDLVKQGLGQIWQRAAEFQPHVDGVDSQNRRETGETIQSSRPGLFPAAGQPTSAVLNVPRGG
jgi:hypothetical protein